MAVPDGIRNDTKSGIDFTGIKCLWSLWGVNYTIWNTPVDYDGGNGQNFKIDEVIFAGISWS